MNNAVQPRPSRPDDPTLRLLLVEDNPGDAMLVQAALAEGDWSFDVEWADRLSVALGRLANGTYDAILLDLNLPDSQGLNTVNAIHAAACGTPMIIMSGTQDRGLAVHAVRLGAQDYLAKGETDAAAMERSIRYAIERSEAQRAAERSEASLVEQKRLLDRAQELAHVGSWVMDGPDGDMVGSPEFFKILGSRVEDGTIPFDAFLGHLVPGDDDALCEALQRCVGGGPRADLEVVLRSDDGDRRVLHIRAEPRPGSGAGSPGATPEQGGHGVKIIGSALDITSRKEAERNLAENSKQLAQNEKLAALGTLIAGVAHEINNPLAFVKSNERLIGMLMDRALGIENGSSEEAAADEAAERIRKLIATNLQGINRIEAIVRSLRQVARPSTGERRELDITRIVRDTLPVLEPVRRDYDVHVEVIGADAPIMVKVNETEISQVTLNLVKNAMEASPPGATVRVIVARTGSGGAQVVVEDQGDGITEEDGPQIFNPFFTTKADGTGLGLPICAKVAESHGGSLTFLNRRNGGAAFTLSLPSPAEAPDAAPVEVATAAGGRVDRRVLRGGTAR